MAIHCNAGTTTTNWVGDLPGVGTVWYHQQGIANILSLPKIKETYRVTFNSATDNVFHVYSKNGNKCREFKQSKQGLYYASLEHNAMVLTHNSTIATVAQNKQNFSLLDQRRALMLFTNDQSHSRATESSPASARSIRIHRIGHQSRTLECV